MTSIFVNIVSDKVQATIKAIVDSGNSVTAGTAISGALHKRLLIGFSQIKTKKTVKTAGSQVLNVLGVSNELKLYIKGVNKVFSIKPIVIEGLSDKLNIGRKWLAQHNASLSFKDNGNTL